MVTAPDTGEEVEVPPAQAAALEVRGLTFRYPDGRLALSGVDLRVEPGERVALLGPNGAGKTTLALHLDGILRPSAGKRAGRRPAGGPGHAARGAPSRAAGVPGPGRPAVQLHGARRRSVRTGEPRPARRRPGPPGGRGTGSGGDVRARRPGAPPPVLRPATTCRDRHRAGDAPRRARARRAHVQPRPGAGAASWARSSTGSPRRSSWPRTTCRSHSSCARAPWCSTTASWWPTARPATCSPTRP